MIHWLIVIIYIAFISLGLPDGLLGSAWPSMYEDLGAHVSYAGILTMIISAGTVVSALFSERIIKKFGTGLTTALSVAMTAVGLLGFAISGEFWMLCLWSIPYGLGAGSVDAALNNFVAIHYESRHMSWLHCFWGVGCCVGPYAMALFLTRGMGWQYGYISVFVIQIILTIVLFLTLPLWKKKAAANGIAETEEASTPIGLRKALKIPGVVAALITFFCYCALEQTAGIWAVSYIVFGKGLDPEAAAQWGAMFYIGITVGRFLGGFVTEKLSDENMIRLGSGIIALGVILIFLPFGLACAFVGLMLVGFGCAPVYPCFIHATPKRFGAEHSQAIIGIQMASAYIGITLMPTIFGWMSDGLGMGIFPVFLSVILVVMVIMSERVNKLTK